MLISESITFYQKINKKYTNKKRLKNPIKIKRYTPICRNTLVIGFRCESGPIEIVRSL